MDEHRKPITIKQGFFYKDSLGSPAYNNLLRGYLYKQIPGNGGQDIPTGSKVPIMRSALCTTLKLLQAGLDMKLGGRCSLRLRLF